MICPVADTYTPDPALVELVASTFITEAKKNPVEPDPFSWGAAAARRLLLGPNEFDIARAVLAALAAAGRLRDTAADVVTPAGWTRRCGPTCTGHPEETQP